MIQRNTEDTLPEGLVTFLFDPEKIIFNVATVSLSMSAEPAWLE